MLKYVSKFVLEIFPSVVATIVGAYIVNYYIIPKAAADKPAAALASTADSKAIDNDSLTKVSPTKVLPTKLAPAATEKVDLAPVDAASDAAPAKPGVKQAADKVTDNSRRHQPSPREKVVAEKPAPKPQPAPVATASVAPSSDVPAAPETRRDANDLARAAIERLRVTAEPRPQEPAPARTPDAARVVVSPAAATPPMPPAIQPLPPAIFVSTPSSDTFNAGQSGLSPQKPPYAPVNRIDESQASRPPADIPTASRPLDLRAEATGSTLQEVRQNSRTDQTTNDRMTVADDMLSAAKSVFHAVLPK